MKHLRSLWSQHVAELGGTETQQRNKLKHVPGWVENSSDDGEDMHKDGRRLRVYWGGSTGKNMAGSVFPFKWEKQKSINLAAL